MINTIKRCAYQSELNRYLTKPRHGVPETLSKFTLNVLTSRTNRTLWETYAKIDILMIKLYFGINRRCITHLCMFFSVEGNIYIKFLRGEGGAPRDVYKTMLPVVLDTKYWDVLGTSLERWPIKFYKFNFQTHWTYFDRLAL